MLGSYLNNRSTRAHTIIYKQYLTSYFIPSEFHIPQDKHITTVKAVHNPEQCYRSQRYIAIIFMTSAYINVRY